MMAMQLLRNPKALSYPVVAAIGTFDGIHLGHQALIYEVQKAKALNAKHVSMLITFEPMPVHFFKPKESDSRLMTFTDKWKCLSHSGIEILTVLTFNKHLAEMPAEAFVIYLKQDLGVSVLVVGEDFRFGFRQKGNVALLSQYQDASFRVIVVPAVLHQEQRVSSTWIRQLFRAGNYSAAHQLLQRAHSFTARVILGSQRGRLLGFPTANLNLAPSICMPYGVYLVKAKLPTWEGFGVMNVGLRPTFGGYQQRSVEIHLLKFSENIYGCKMECQILDKIRSEIKFTNSNALAQQIVKDIEQAEQILTEKVTS